jgi:hypothetical protein
MGWGRTLLLGDWGNQMDIQDTRSDVADLESRLGDQGRRDMAQDQRIDALERESDELKLYLASLLRLLVRKGTLTQEELSAFVDVLDKDQPTSR